MRELRRLGEANIQVVLIRGNHDAESRITARLPLPAGSRIVERERYYRSAKPEVRKRCPSEEAMLLAIESRHDGPWDDMKQMKE